MMNSVSNYGMSMNSQVNFQGKRINSKTLGLNIKGQMNEIEKKLDPKVEEIMSRVKKGQITYSEALDALSNLLSQIKKFEAFI